MREKTDEQNQNNQNKSKKKIMKVKVSQYVYNKNEQNSLEELDRLEKILSKKTHEEKIVELLENQHKLIKILKAMTLDSAAKEYLQTAYDKNITDRQKIFKYKSILQTVKKANISLDSLFETIVLNAKKKDKLSEIKHLFDHNNIKISNIDDYSYDYIQESFAKLVGTQDCPQFPFISPEEYEEHYKLLAGDTNDNLHSKQ